MRLDSIVIFPGGDITNLVTHAGSEQVSIRSARAFDKFATALGSHTSATIQVADELTLPVPADGVIFICRPDVLERSLKQQSDRVHLLSSRTVVVDLVRTYALEWAERLALAAVVPTEQYFHWQDGGTNKGLPAFFGLKSVGETLGATWPDAPQTQGPNYALLRHDQIHDLPAFLAEYLRAYVPHL